MTAPTTPSPETLAKLLAEATPGPWTKTTSQGDRVILSPMGDTMMCDMTYYPWCPDEEADWELIALAPTLAARALADAETIARLREALEVCKRSIESGGGGGVTCVVWADTCPSETLCDFIDAALTEDRT